MTSVLYFLHLKTLDITLLIVNISVADDAFYKYNVLLLYFIDTMLHERMLIFNSCLLLLRRLKEGKTKAKNGLHSVIYLLYNSKSISVIGYINVQSIGIGYKASIWVITSWSRTWAFLMALRENMEESLVSAMETPGRSIFISTRSLCFRFSFSSLFFFLFTNKHTADRSKTPIQLQQQRYYH